MSRSTPAVEARQWRRPWNLLEENSRERVLVLADLRDAVGLSSMTAMPNTAAVSEHWLDLDGPLQ